MIQENIYIPKRHIIGRMGANVKLVKILGTEEMPYKPSPLETFAASLADRRDLTLDEKENGLHQISLTYYYKTEASKEDFSVAYELTCHSDIGSENLEEAIQEFKRRMKIGRFDEHLVLKNGSRRVSIMRQGNLTLEGASEDDRKYSCIVEGSKYSTIPLTLNQICTLSFFD